MRTNKFLNFFRPDDSAPRLFQMSAKFEAAASKCADTDFKAQIKTESTTCEIIMHDAIGDSWSGLDSATLVKEIKAARGKQIVLDINSFGGLAYEGIAIYNALAQHDAEVVANITGMAYSAASIIPMAADTINIAENGGFGIHPAWLYAMGNRFAFGDLVDFLTTLDSQLLATYVARTGKKLTQITEWFEGKNHDGTVFSGSEAVEHGFADSVIPLKKKPSKNESDGDSENSYAKNLRERMDAFNRKHGAMLRQERIARLKRPIADRSK